MMAFVEIKQFHARLLAERYRPLFGLTTLFAAPYKKCAKHKHDIVRSLKIGLSQKRAGAPPKEEPKATPALTKCGRNATLVRAILAVARF
jgi:hypothetical protein